MERFFLPPRGAGGRNALIFVVPTASGEPETGARYVEEFTRRYGCSRVAVLDIRERSDAGRDDDVSLIDAGAWLCGMVAGLIHDIPTCRELIDRIMGRAEQLITERLPSLLGGGVDHAQRS